MSHIEKWATPSTGTRKRSPNRRTVKLYQTTSYPTTSIHVNAPMPASLQMPSKQQSTQSFRFCHEICLSSSTDSPTSTSCLSFCWIGCHTWMPSQKRWPCSLCSSCYLWRPWRTAMKTTGATGPTRKWITFHAESTPGIWFLHDFIFKQLTGSL